MSGSIDLWGSRRANFERCEWFERDEKVTRDLSKIVYKTKPTRVFYAKEANAVSYQKSDLGGVFLSDESVATIQTQDDVNGIKGGDMVKFRGVEWKVQNVQATEAHKQSQFMETVTHTTYIGLKR